MSMEWAHLELERPLGKGEVVSSILTGSTTICPIDGHFLHSLRNIRIVSATNDARTSTFKWCKIGALRSPHVHGGSA